MRLSKDTPLEIIESYPVQAVHDYGRRNTGYTMDKVVHIRFKCSHCGKTHEIEDYTFWNGKKTSRVALVKRILKTLKPNGNRKAHIFIGCTYECHEANEKKEKAIREGSVYRFMLEVDS